MAPSQVPQLIVLGIAQDGGYPQAGCRKLCCRSAHIDASRVRFPASLAIVENRRCWLLDCTPQVGEQLALLDQLISPRAELDSPSDRLTLIPDGILLTHAHMGHYTGLLQLGPEAIGARGVPVYVMPRMADFLIRNQPWRAAVEDGTLELRPLSTESPLRLSEQVRVRPILVPHRDEWSETVGFWIDGPTKSLLYLPDIDDWDLWDQSLEQLLPQLDVAFLDGTFYDDGELGNRSMEAIPHPRVRATMQRLSTLPSDQTSVVRFIHLNHTNPLLNPQSEESRYVRQAGFRIAVQGEVMDI